METEYERLLPEGWTMDSVRANGVDLGCYRTGSGPPVVMAHGFGESGLRWVPLADDLAADYEVVAYDARGHGRSDAPETGYRLDDRIADLRGLVRELGLEEPILLGHSMGAATVAWTAARHPDLPRAIALEDPIGLHEQSDRDPDERAATARERREEVVDSTIEELVEQHPNEDPVHARRLAIGALDCSPQTAERLAREGYPAPHAETFSEIACPTLVLRSDVDLERRLEDVAAADSLRDGRLVHVPNAGHHVFDDEYDAAYAELRTFLRRL